MPSDTRALLGPGAEKCESRSLFMDRFADPEAKDSGKDSQRRTWFDRLKDKKIAQVPRRSWRSQLPHGRVFYAQLQSRLMVNMAGGVMENAGLCLDRFGLPYLPGSTVKGCARRMAIQELLEAESEELKTEVLHQVALVFGWSDQEWSRSQREGRYISDFAYAVGDEWWVNVSQRVRERLPRSDQFGGLVGFLPAYPVDAREAKLPMKPTALGAIELDVLTCHHPEYYADKRPSKVATDDEPPIPVVFPAVAAGQVFEFALSPLRACSDSLLGKATEWLMGGLTVMGIGAKTAAGYGWFDCSDAVHEPVLQRFVEREKKEEEQRQQEAKARADQLKKEAEQKQREEEKARLATMTPEDRQDYEVSKLTQDQFRSALDNFLKKSPDEQKSLVRALRLDPADPKSRRQQWEDLKTRATKKKGNSVQVENAIRQLSKQLFPGKEGKMP